MQQHMELRDEVASKRLQVLGCLDHLLDVGGAVPVVGFGGEGCISHFLVSSEICEEVGQLTGKNCL